MCVRVYGYQRRFTIRAEVGFTTIIDDYAHHPVEIMATLETAAEAFAGCRIIAVFQAHRYSRLHQLWDDFCAAFSAADEVVVCPIYAAGERPIEGVSRARFAAEMRERGHRGVRCVEDLQDAAHSIVSRLGGKKSIVITLGAGDVNQVCSLTESLLRS